MAQKSGVAENQAVGRVCHPVYGSACLRVGAVSFLNTKPLIYPLLNGELPGVEVARLQRAPTGSEGSCAKKQETKIGLSVEVPSRLAVLLKANELDVGLIPIIEYFRAPDAGYRILPDISIASRGSVLSIQLFSRVPIPEIRQVALDTSSRSSIALLKILLAEKYGIHPTFTPCAPSTDPGASASEAVLLIGDAALRRLNATKYSLDLGTAWHELTGLPFVYACWVARTGVQLGDAPDVLREAKTRGITQIPEIARIESQKLGLPEPLCRDYLQKHIHYDLGHPEIAGLRRFYALAVKHQLAAPGRKVVFA